MGVVATAAVEFDVAPIVLGLYLSPPYASLRQSRAPVVGQLYI